MPSDERLIPEGEVWRFTLDGHPHFVHQFRNGTFANIYGRLGSGTSLPSGLTEPQVREKQADPNVPIHRLPRAETPWRDGAHLDRPRLLPEGEVWKFVYEASHAPHYTIQHASGLLLGVYAPVENVPQDPTRPFGFRRATVQKTRARGHVDVIELPREESPWADGVFLGTDDAAGGAQ